MGIISSANNVYGLQAMCFFLGGYSPCLAGYSKFRNFQKQFDENHSEYKTTNMGPPGDASCLTRTSGCADELEQEPKTKKQKRRDINKIRDKKNRDKRKDFSPGKKQQVGSHNPGDGTAGSDCRDLRVPVDEEVRYA